MTAYDRDLDRNPANFAPLTPLNFVERAAAVYPERIAVIHGALRRTWRETWERSRRLASALARAGIGHGDTVSMLAPNTPAMIEAHYAVPLTGGVLNAINTRLDAATITFILEHGEAKVLLVDRELAPLAAAALARTDRRPLVIDIDDPAAPPNAPIGSTDYESFLAGGDPQFGGAPPADEWDAIALNYTSGTTGDPKGVVIHHRGAYLNAVGNVLTWGLSGHPVYLWTLPLFHCNGWCFPWTIAALAGTQVCLRRVEAAAIFEAIAGHGVTHLCGAPVVLGLLIHAAEADQRPFAHTVEVMTAASPPPAAVIERMEREGFRITHVYGLTEVYGPAVTCAWHEEWDALPPEERARRKARQGVRYAVLEGLRIGDPATLEPVPADGATMGEVLMRGNIVMKGYFKNPAATQAAFAGGWFHTGDLGVRHPDGYIELKDRSKDIIISGGENISTIEVEAVLHRHPAVEDAAVVARPDEKWGETPCAFVKLRPGHSATEAEIIAFAREHLAHFKAPKTVVFADLARTAAGKIDKVRLRAIAAAL
ncbi:acyl-CoA synthetase [Arenibaculum pallidiluteum]|uniref:acyl-CoA synthetase n=1 Tax=Arenibaculum pallidiluteum TaxID=2812559 RepID=UPI001A957B02|nr:acyl-CoA synthetase [Arenibaculum pallidiluteum]